MNNKNIFLSSVAMITALQCIHTVARADGAPKDVSALPPIKWGLFVDTYYGYDFNNPPNFERAFLTQAKRSDEFNVNLAFIDAQVNADQWRGRLALQAGTSVQANYAAEPNLGATSGPNLARDIQEGFVGYRVSDKLWIDSGIMFSYIGFENWVSSTNWTYTRSMDADFTPYYQSGARATYQLTDQISTQFNLMNGWQDISNYSAPIAVGVQVAFSPNQTYTLTYNNFIGQAPASNGFISERFFNQLIVQVNLSSKFQLSATGDIGFQDIYANGGASHWWDGTLLARYQFAPTLALAGRAEYYSDPSQVIVSTSTPNGFQTWGASVNVDDQLTPWVLWRTEFRWLQSEDRVFPGRSGPFKSDPLVVTSLALKI